MARRLYRLPEQGQIAGVAAGLGEYFKIDPTVVRVLFVLAALLTSGWFVLGYIVLAIILPVEGQKSATFEARVSDLTDIGDATKLHNWLGIGLVLIGAWYLVSYLWPGLIAISWGAIWPIALILVGIVILMKGKK